MQGGRDILEKMKGSGMPVGSHGSHWHVSSLDCIDSQGGLMPCIHSNPIISL